MMKLELICVGVLSLMMANVQAEPSSYADGHVRKQANAAPQAWDAQAQDWVTLEAFWRAYAKRHGGITWGQSASYPEYDKVNEYDLFLVEAPQGLCLMQFFHSRWRRANDVQRWHDAFNQYSGCPYVFD